MEKLVQYFSQRAVVVNVVLFGLIFSAVVLWPNVGKEEMPDFAFNWVRVSIPFSGASSGDVELFITKQVEEKLKGVTSLEEVKSTSAYGLSSFQVSFELNTPNLQEKIQEIKDAVDSVDLPREAEEPRYRQFRSSEKAILDVGLYLKDKEILDVESRILLQKYALAFKDRLLSLKRISGLTVGGYLRPELQVKVRPERLKEFEVSMDQIQSQISQQHVRRPIGSMKHRAESDVSLIGELDDVESLNNVIASSGFDGQEIRLSELANVDQGFERNNQVIKMSSRFTSSVNRKEISVGFRLAMPFKDNKANVQKKIKVLDLKYGELDQLGTTGELKVEKTISIIERKSVLDKIGVG